MMNEKPWFNDAWNQLTNRVDNDTLPHALLLAGPKGIGKREFTHKLAEHIFGKPAATHPDFFELTPEEDKKNISVNQVRELIQRLAQTSHQQGFKVAIIYPAEAMNIAASNAILKTLEEPLGNTLLILCSHQPSLLLPTVVSRCQRVKLGRIPKEEYGSRINFSLADAIQKVRDDGAGNRLNDVIQKGISLVDLLNVNPVKLAEILAKEEDLELLLDEMFLFVGDSIKSDKTPVSEKENRLLYNILDKITAAKRSVQTQSNPNKQLLLENLLLEFICN